MFKKGLMIIFWGLLMLCGINAIPETVYASDDYDITVFIGGKEVSDYYEEDNISVNVDNREIILNGYEGWDIDIYTNLDKTCTFTIRVNGKNEIYGAGGNAISCDNDIDLKIVGNGVLNCTGKSTSYDVSVIYGARNVEIDGPTINSDLFMRFCEIIGKFVLKNGTLNIKSEINISNYENNGKRFVFTKNLFVAIDSIELNDNKVNISYYYPEKYTEDMILTNETSTGYKEYYYMFYTCHHEPEINSKNVTVNIPDKVKDFILLKKENKVQFSFVKEGKLYQTYNPNEIKGLSWDDKNKTLTMNGYNGSWIGIGCYSYHNNISINVKGKNVINETEIDYFANDRIYLAFAFGEYQNSLHFDQCDGTIKGDGELKIISGSIGNRETRDSYYYYTIQSIVTIDGASVVFEKMLNNSFHVDGFVMKSGNVTVNYNRDYSKNEYDNSVWLGSVIYAKEKGVKINGGTLVVSYEKLADTNISYYINPIILENVNEDFIGKNQYEPIDIDNCSIIIIGIDKNMNFDKPFSYNIDYSDDEIGYEGDDLKVNIGSNAHIVYAKTSKDVSRIDIKNFKATLDCTEYLYDGKAKTPKVNVAGLVEGINYTVTYSNNIKVGTGVAIVKGIGFYDGTINLSFNIKANSSIAKKYGPKKGNIISDKVLKYKVVRAASEDGTVIGKLSVIGLKKKNAKKITIKPTVKIGGFDYKVVSIKNKAFYKSKKLKKVVIKAKKLKLGKKAFAIKNAKKVKVFVPKKLKKKYKKLLKKYKNIVVK